MTQETSQRLYLIRHAQSMQNLKGDLQADSPLTELGREQALSAGLLLKQLLGDQPLSILIHTGLQRTVLTAQLIQQAANFDAQFLNRPEFREREMGVYDQMEFAELIARNPHLEALYQKYKSSCVWFLEGAPGEAVEPLREMQERVLQGLTAILSEFPQQSVALVAHAGSIKMIRASYENISLDQLPYYLSSYVPKNGEIFTVE